MISEIGRYRIERHLGSGAFAGVFLAFDPALDALVALKILGDHVSADPDVRERFVREGRLLRRLGDASVDRRLVTVHDIAEDDGRPYLVMEYVAGGSLEDRLRATGHRPLGAWSESAPHLVNELAGCLAVVHDQGVTHRDVKPSNLLIRTEEGYEPDRPWSLLSDGESLVLADFGLARDADQTNLTAAAGTPGFSAPEQLSAAATLDERTDLYAATQVVIASVLGRPCDLPALLSAVEGSSTRTVLARCLADNPQERPSKVATWQREIRTTLPTLAHCLDGRGGVLDPSTAPPARRLSWWRRRDQSGRPLRGVVAPIALALTLVLAVAWWQWPADAPDSGDGPQIIGPQTLLVGEAGTYTHEQRPGVTYRWTMPDGGVSEATSIEVTPTDAGDLVVELTAEDDGAERTTRLTIRVRTQ